MDAALGRFGGAKEGREEVTSDVMDCSWREL